MRKCGVVVVHFVWDHLKFAYTCVCCMCACVILSEGRRFRLIEFYPTASKNMSHFDFSVVCTERSCHLPCVCARMCERERKRVFGLAVGFSY